MSTDDARFVLLLLHTVAACVALVAGAVAVGSGRGTRIHVGSTWIMTLLLVPSLALGFDRFDGTTRIAFAALTVLALVMSLRVTLAARSAAAVGEITPPSRRLADALGFNVISLVVAGTIVPILRLGAGPLVVALDVVVCIVLGRLFVEVRRRSAGRPVKDVPA